MVKESTRESGVSVHDRQRDRAARGIRSRSAVAAQQDRPSPPRRRRPAIAAIAVLLIVGGAAIAGLLALRLDSREPVLVLTQPVAPGTEITTDMLGTTRVASEGLDLIPEKDARSVLGTFARTALEKGQLLDTTMVVSGDPIGDDQVRVGVALTPGQYPPGLQSGDEVRILRLGDGSAQVAPLAVGLVIDIGATEDGGLSGSGGGTLATLLVPAEASDDVVDASGNDKLGMALVRRGVPVKDAQLTVLGDS
jgi:hypothetical protein